MKPTSDTPSTACAVTAAQNITIPAGEELVILPRRDYNALLARFGGEVPGEAAVPDWFAVLLSEHGSPVTAARKHRGCTQAELAAVLGISQGHLSDIERARRALTQPQAHQIAGHTGVQADWLA